MLAAARAVHIEKDFTSAIEHMRKAKDADDANMYIEPPRVWVTPRECLGALLVSAPKDDGLNATEALQTFKEDLTNFVENPWSLYGAARAARILGDEASANNFTARADRAWSQADSKFVQSCPELAAVV